MLRRALIRKFRSCKDVDLNDLSAMTVLVGRNGAGKTNILAGIEWIATFASAQKRSPLSFLEDFSGVIEFTFKTKDYCYEVSNSHHGPHNKLHPFTEKVHHRVAGTWEKLVERSGGAITIPGSAELITIGETVTCLPALAALLPSTHPAISHVNAILSYFSQIRYYPLGEQYEMDASPLGFIPISQKDYDQWLAAFNSTRNPGRSVEMKLLHMSFSQKEKFEELRQLLGGNGLGLIHELSVTSINAAVSSKDDESGSRTQFHFVMYTPMDGNKQEQLSFNSLSFGTRRVLQILTSMVFDDSSVMLIEHPEDGLHSGLLKKVFGILHDNTQPVQMIVSSHSDDVFNTITPKEIRIVSISNGLTSVRPLSDREIDAASNYMHGDGPLSDFIETIEGE